MDDVLRVGIITTSHGLKGEVKVFSTTDDNNRYKELKSVLLDTGKEMLNIEIENVKFFKNIVILKLKGYDSINDIEKFKEKELFVTRENAVKLEEGEHFITDLIGLSVVTSSGDELGIVTDVLQTGANDVYVIKGTEREILIPAIKQCILDIDLQKKLMKVNLIEGLLDLWRFMC